MSPMNQDKISKAKHEVQRHTVDIVVMGIFPVLTKAKIGISWKSASMEFKTAMKKVSFNYNTTNPAAYTAFIGTMAVIFLCKFFLSC